jgi:cytochrome c oxidase subunit 2
MRLALAASSCRGQLRRCVRGPYRWALFAVPLVVLALGACSHEDPANTFAYNGYIAEKVGELFWFTFWIAVVVFVIVHAVLLFALFRFRRRPGHAVPSQVHGNTTFEVGWTILPTVLLVIAGIPTIQGLFELDEPPSTPLEVEVVGHQWWWEFQYPSLNVTTAGELHIPVGQPVRVQMQSVDVVHSWWVPRLAGKKDVFPGRVNHMWFNATDAGIYYGQCAEFCGIEHAQMRFYVIADPPATFQSWVQAQQAPAATPPAGSAAQRGADLILPRGCIACHTIEGTVARGNVGPNLTHVGSRSMLAGGAFDNTPENLARWLHDPQAVKPGNKMILPQPLSDDDVRDLVAYLSSLR